MNFISNFKNFLKEQRLKYLSRDYVVLLENFDLKDERNTNQIFKELKNSSISIIGSNGGSKEWSFLVSFKQQDNFDHSKNIIDIMSPVLAKFGLKIERVWLK
jgi:hypothetical protein